MRYVILGTLNSQWATKHARRTKLAIAKLKALKIELISVNYTQGQFDFVDILDAPNAEAMLAFSVWYVKQGFGRFQSMPAFDMKAMHKALRGV
jgi:uncharacterized protein with GYD domain